MDRAERGHSEIYVLSVLALSHSSVDLKSHLPISLIYLLYSFQICYQLQPVMTSLLSLLLFIVAFCNYYM
jgi:hypothetical protein